MRMDRCSHGPEAAGSSAELLSSRGARLGRACASPGSQSHRWPTRFGRRLCRPTAAEWGRGHLDQPLPASLEQSDGRSQESSTRAISPNSVESQTPCASEVPSRHALHGHLHFRDRHLEPALQIGVPALAEAASVVLDVQLGWSWSWRCAPTSKHEHPRRRLRLHSLPLTAAGRRSQRHAGDDRLRRAHSRSRRRRWVGPDPVPGSVDAIAGLREFGVQIVFLTNDSRSSRAEYAARLTELGIPAESSQIVTWAAPSHGMSGREDQALAPSPSDRRCSRRSWREAAYGARASQPRSSQSAFTTISTTTSFEPLRKTLRRGATLAAGRDATFPMPDGPWPGAGSSRWPLSKCGGTRAITVGKPEPYVFDVARSVLHHCDRVHRR